ncbi:MAG: 50S ribosomal protein L10 [Candidatus Omnitrophica bacterium]|nr:50S ribosomal protein L10 [Candidatus Omnitrophota bacterium]
MKVGEIYRKKMAASVKDGIGKKSNAFVMNFQGVSSAQMDSLRKDLKRKKADVLVAKTSVSRIAFKTAEFESLAERLKGQTALVLSDADASEISKILVKFAKDREGVILCGGVLDGSILNTEQIKVLSDLPSRPALLAKFLGTLNAPMTRFAGALNAKTLDFVSILKQKSEKV